MWDFDFFDDGDIYEFDVFDFDGNGKHDREKCDEDKHDECDSWMDEWSIW